MKRVILTQLALAFVLLLMTPAANAQTETCNCLDNLNKTI